MNTNARIIEDDSPLGRLVRERAGTRPHDPGVTGVTGVTGATEPSTLTPGTSSRIDLILTDLEITAPVQASLCSELADPQRP